MSQGTRQQRSWIRRRHWAELEEMLTSEFFCWWHWKEQIKYSPWTTVPAALVLPMETALTVAETEAMASTNANAKRMVWLVKNVLGRPECLWVRFTMRNCKTWRPFYTMKASTWSFQTDTGHGCSLAALLHEMSLIILYSLKVSQPSYRPCTIVSCDLQ